MKSIINLYLYSSFHIALCALCLVLSSYFLFDIKVDYCYVLFVSSGTWLLYSLHRIIGISKVANSRIENRFVLIRKYHNHLIIYAAFAGILSLVSFFCLPRNVQIRCLLPAFFALLYVLPILFKKNRLRDINYLKIFFVSACWALLCGYIPVFESNLNFQEICLFVSEKGIFIFAITLPFDYRDLEVDKESGVKTIAHFLKDKIVYGVSISFLLCIILVFINYAYSFEQKISLFIIYGILELITRYSMKKQNDYYFSGIIDGTMIIFYLFLVVANYLFLYF